MPEIIATHYHRGVQNKGPSIHNRIWYCIYSNLLVFFFAICTCASQMSLCFSLFLTLGLLGRLKYNTDQNAGCNSVLISCLPDPKWQWEPVEVVVANVQADLSHNHLRGSENGWVKVKEPPGQKLPALKSSSQSPWLESLPGRVVSINGHRICNWNPQWMYIVSSSKTCHDCRHLIPLSLLRILKMSQVHNQSLS